jgi:hypothetical protein
MSASVDSTITVWQYSYIDAEQEIEKRKSILPDSDSGINTWIFNRRQRKENEYWHMLTAVPTLADMDP